jgi:hypothetical protein
MCTVMKGITREIILNDKSLLLICSYNVFNPKIQKQSEMFQYSDNDIHFRLCVKLINFNIFVNFIINKHVERKKQLENSLTF